MKNKEKFWDRIAKNYDTQVDQGDQEGIRSIEITKKYLQPEDVVLDFGCATGKFSFEIAGFVNEVYGIDISSEMIGIANRVAADRNLENVKFSQTTIFDAHYQNGDFDVVLSFNSLHLLEEPQKAVQRIWQLLKPGGLFISSTVCMGKGLSFYRLILWPLGKVGVLPYMNFFKPPDIEELILQENFDIIETETFSSSPSSLFTVARKG